jgi:hypothetical protein
VCDGSTRAPDHVASSLPLVPAPTGPDPDGVDVSEDVVNPALTMRYGEVDRDYAHRMATMPPEQDGPVWMVNLMRYPERAEYADRRPTDLTGWQADEELVEP